MKNNIIKSILFTLSIMSSVTYATSSDCFEPGRTIFLDTKNVPNWADDNHYPYMYLFHNSNSSKEWIKMVGCGNNVFKGVVPNVETNGEYNALIFTSQDYDVGCWDNRILQTVDLNYSDFNENANCYVLDGTYYNSTQIKGTWTFVPNEVQEEVQATDKLLQVIQYCVNECAQKLGCQGSDITVTRSGTNYEFNKNTIYSFGDSNETTYNLACTDNKITIKTYNNSTTLFTITTTDNNDNPIIVIKDTRNDIEEKVNISESNEQNLKAIQKSVSGYIENLESLNQTLSTQCGKLGDAYYEAGEIYLASEDVYKSIEQLKLAANSYFNGGEMCGKLKCIVDQNTLKHAENIYNMIGQCYLANENVSESKEYFKLAGNCYETLGNNYNTKGNYYNAGDYYIQAGDAYTKAGTKKVWEAYTKAGNAYKTAGNDYALNKEYTSAGDYYVQAGDAYTAAGNNEENKNAAKDAYTNAAENYETMGNYHKEEAQNYKESQNNEVARNNKAIQNYTSAGYYYIKTGEVYAKAGNEKSKEAYQKAGTAYYESGTCNQSNGGQTKDAQFYCKAGDDYVKAGNAYTLAGKDEDAKKAYTAAKNAYEAEAQVREEYENPNYEIIGGCYMNAGDACKKAGITNTMNDYKNAAQAYKTAGDENSKKPGKTYASIGTCYRRAGDAYTAAGDDEENKNAAKNAYTNAATNYKKGGDSYKENKEYGNAGDDYVKAGNAYKAAGNDTNAKTAYNKATESYKMAGNIEKEKRNYNSAGDSYMKAGDVYIRIDDKAKAKSLYKKAIFMYILMQNNNKIEKLFKKLEELK